MARQSCPGAGRTVEVKCTAEGVDPIRESAHPGPPIEAGASDAIVGDLQPKGIVMKLDGHDRSRRSRVLGDVREAF